MNLPNEETNLSLFRYIPEVTSQLLIQANESQELVPVPSICDDLLLNDLEAGNTWTLDGLPVLLNGPFPSNDQSSDAEPNIVFESHKSPLPEILGASPEPQENSVSGMTKDNVISYPLDLASKSFLSEDCLFITNIPLEEPGFTGNVGEESEINENIQHLDVATVNEIQSSDISSQQTFIHSSIDLNGSIIPQYSLLSSNEEILLNIPDHPEHAIGVPKPVKKKRIRNIKNKLPQSNVKQKHSKKAANSKKRLKRNLNINNIEKEDNKNVCEENGDPNLIEILNLDGSKTYLNLSGNIFNSAKNPLSIESCDNVVQNLQSELCIKDEPDSTVVSDSDNVNIDDIAELVMSFKCKKCKFSCNDHDRIMVHYRKNHIKKKNKAVISDNPTEENNQQTLNLICTNNNLSNSLISAQEENEKKIMRVKRKSKIEKKINPENNTTEPTVNINDLNEMFSLGVIDHLENGVDKPDSNLDEVDNNFGQMENDVGNLENNMEEVHNLGQKQNDAGNIENNVEEVDNNLKQMKNDVSNIENNLDQIENVENNVEQMETGMLNVDRDNSEITIFLCSNCGNQFLTVDDCRNHMIKDHDMYPVDDTDNKINANIINLKKETIDEESLTFDDEETHFKNIKAIEKFTSDILKSQKIRCTVRGCPYRFAKTELLAQHESCHVEGMKGQFRCSECGLVQDSWKLCSLHLWQFHQMDVDLYSCPLCDYKGSTANKLKNHVKIHSEEREFICTDCGRGFKQAAQLRNHRVRHLDKKKHEVPRWYTQKRCDKCGKIFADSKCLKKHTQAVHSKLKPFICNVCGHTCSRKAMLQMHLRQHTGEKPYSCSICYYKTGDHNSLRRHIMRHSGVRPYKCPHCNYTAIQSNSYKSHLASKHPGMSGSYSCTECPFKTVNDEAFTSHVNDHRNGHIASTNDLQMQGAENEDANSADILFTSVTEPTKNGIYSNEKSLMSSIQNLRYKSEIDLEDDETQNCFLSLSDLTDEQTVDTGGITIPAEPADPL